MSDRDALADVERLAVGDGGDEEEDDEPASNVWDELDRRASKGDAIHVDIIDVVRRRPNVRGDTIIKLKVVAGAEMRTVEPMSWQEDGHQWYSWVSHPDLRDHEVAVLSATHMPHVTDRWLETACGTKPVHRSATDDWKAVRRAQGYLLIQTREGRNSRSGAGAYHNNPEQRRQAMRDRRDELMDAIEELEGERPGLIDAKKLLDEDEGINFARVWSNNEYKDMLLGLVAGATYYGDEWVKARAAYCGRNVDIVHERGEKAKCADEVGADLMHYMTSTAVEQAVTRYGRDGGETTRVYLDTDVVPPHFPAIDISNQVVRLTETQKSILEAAREGEETLEELGRAAGVTRSMAGRAVWQLEDLGLIKVAKHALAYGKHQVGTSGRTAIGDINIVRLPEIPRPDNEHLLRDDVEADEQASVEDRGAQLTMDNFGPPPG
jgi:hypothetical protein